MKVYGVYYWHTYDQIVLCIRYEAILHGSANLVRETIGLAPAFSSFSNGHCDEVWTDELILLGEL